MPPQNQGEQAKNEEDREPATAQPGPKADAEYPSRSPGRSTAKDKQKANSDDEFLLTAADFADSGAEDEEDEFEDAKE
jgi:hypothetical protein